MANPIIPQIANYLNTGTLPPAPYYYFSYYPDQCNALGPDIFDGSPGPSMVPGVVPLTAYILNYINTGTLPPAPYYYFSYYPDQCNALGPDIFDYMPPTVASAAAIPPLIVVPPPPIVVPPPPAAAPPPLLVTKPMDVTQMDVMHKPQSETPPEEDFLYEVKDKYKYLLLIYRKTKNDDEYKQKVLNIIVDLLPRDTLSKFNTSMSVQEVCNELNKYLSDKVQPVIAEYNWNPLLRLYKHMKALERLEIANNKKKK